MKRRGCGVLLHITSLPSSYGIGDLGPWAYKFADFLAETKQSFWQILPLNPTDSAHGNSPYNSVSAFANNTILISPECLVQDGFLEKNDIENPPLFPKHTVHYHDVTRYKRQLFCRAHEHFKKNHTNRYTYEYERFCRENSNWLEDFALFVALKDHFQGKVWSEWPEEIRDRKPEPLETLRKQLENKIGMEKFLQYLFFHQWSALKNYCNDRNIHLIGDIPIYVCYDSADVWAHPRLFKLDERKQPVSVAGVPPDYFSTTGQRWGNPVYQWDILKETRYAWWIQRIKQNLSLFDMVRIDHFRGFVAYWEVPSSEKTAINGRWTEVPVEDFFTTLFKHFPSLPIIAEDLGTITPDVREIIHRFEFPGMKLLLFAFGWNLSTNPYAPHNHVKNCVVYTGTHDNNTVRGWFENEIPQEDKERLFHYLGREVPGQEIHWELIRLAMMSVANMVIVPMQDVLGLGEESRMNRPSITEGNWLWRLLPEQITPSPVQKFRGMTEIYGRG